MIAIAVHQLTQLGETKPLVELSIAATVDVEVELVLACRNDLNLEYGRFTFNIRYRLPPA